MPFQNQIHVDQLLSNLAVKYKSPAFIAEEIAPVLPVKKDSDSYRVYTRNFRIPETKRANKGLANELSFEVSTASYLVEYHALKDYVSDSDARNWDINDLRADTVEELTDAILRRQDYNTSLLMTTTSWSLNVSLAATQTWTLETTASNPIIFMHTAASTIIGNGSLAPNVGMIPHAGYLAAIHHPSILDRLKYTSAEVTANVLAKLFELDKLVIPMTQYDTSQKGLTESLSALWGSHAWVGYVTASPSFKSPSAMYTIKVDEPMVKRWRDEEREAEGIKVEKKFVPKVVASLSGYLIKAVV